MNLIDAVIIFANLAVAIVAYLVTRKRRPTTPQPERRESWPFPSRNEE